MQLERAAENNEMTIEYAAAALCPYCHVGPHQSRPPIPHECLVEFDDGSVLATVWSWRCQQCLLRVMPDGREYGIVSSSPFTAFSESYLFELAVNLSRNGCSLRSSSDLRYGFSELSAPFKYADSSRRLRSLSTLRKGLLLYLRLVIKGLPLAVSTCSTCVRAGGLMDVVCFDGLQLGYNVKYKRAFERPIVRTSAIPGGSVHAHLITNPAVSKALGSVFNASSSMPVSSAKTVTTLTAMRGYMIAVSTLLGNVARGGKEETFAGKKQHGRALASEKCFCRLVNGGVRSAMITFLQRFFRCELVARSLCIQMVAANADLFRRMPAPLQSRVKDFLRAHAAVVHPLGGTANASPPPPERPTEKCGSDHSGSMAPAKPAADAGAPAAGRPTVNGLKFNPDNDEWGADWPENVSEVEESDDELTSADERWPVADESPEEAHPYWSSLAPLVRYAELFTEPALADTGGKKGTKLEADMLFRLQPEIPTTAAATIKVSNFVRALAVDPYVLWAPEGDWGAIYALLEVLNKSSFVAEDLAAVLDRPDVRELRLLRGAVACLGPGLVANAGLRPVLADLLTAIKVTGASYAEYVTVSQRDGDPNDDEDGEHPEGAHRSTDEPPVPFSREQMACAPARESFTPDKYTATWLSPPASVASFRAAYGLTDWTTEDFLKTGVWAPSFPILRPIPQFDGSAQAATDEPYCNHLVGR